jgi:hypothetical protein
VLAGNGTLSHRLLQNDGAAHFKDVSAAAALAATPAAGLAIVPTDFDNRRDIDLLFAGPKSVQLFQNGRDGTFRDVAGAVGLSAVATALGVAAGDINKDDATDFVFAVDGGPARIALSDGKSHFAVADAPEATRDARQVLVLDYDGDGLLDLVVLGKDGLHVLRNVGRAGWADVSTAALPAAAGKDAVVSFAAGDIDGDGHPDIVARLSSGALRVLQSRGATTRGLDHSPRGSGQQPQRGGLEGDVARGQPASAPGDVRGHASRRPRRPGVRPGSAHRRGRRACPLAGLGSCRRKSPRRTRPAHVPPPSWPSRSWTASPRPARISTPGTAASSPSSPTSWAGARWVTGKAPASTTIPTPTNTCGLSDEQLRPR